MMVVGIGDAFTHLGASWQYQLYDVPEFFYPSFEGLKMLFLSHSPGPIKHRTMKIIVASNGWATRESVENKILKNPVCSNNTQVIPPPTPSCHVPRHSMYLCLTMR